MYSEKHSNPKLLPLKILLDGLCLTQHISQHRTERFPSVKGSDTPDTADT